MTVNVCKYRKNQPRVSLEICQYHIKQKDPVCLRRLTHGKMNYVCEIARQVMDEK